MKNNTKNIKKTENTQTHKSIQITVTQINTASPLVYNNMGWLGDSSHRGQGCQAWTAVGLPPRYPRVKSFIKLCVLRVDCKNGAQVFTQLTAAQLSGDLSCWFSHAISNRLLTWEWILFLQRFSHWVHLILWHPLLPAIKHPVPDRAMPSFVIFDIQAIRVPRYQKLQMTA